MRDNAGVEAAQDQAIACARCAHFTRGDWVVHLGIVVSFAAALVYPLVTGLFPSSRISSAVSHGCILKTVTGIPCPACGFTRSCHALLRGNAVDCFRYNPFSLVYIAGLGIIGVFSLRAIRRREPLLLPPRLSAVVLLVLATAWLLKLLGPREFW